VLWPLLLAGAPSRVTLQGGTHNPLAPSASYLQATLPQVLAQTGGVVNIDVQRHGFYPAGGGVVAVGIEPAAKLRPLHFTERGALLAASATCLHGGVPKSVAQRELTELQAQLGWGAGQLHDRALRANEGPGNVLTAELRYEGITEAFTAFGERGVSAEQVARQLAAQVRAYQASTAPVGEYLADQLMLPLALAGGGSYLATVISEHARTNAAVIEAFLPLRFAFEPQADGSVRVAVAPRQSIEEMFS
jgi:RNA 3'-terminal phosphate cyclase (ATP)